MNEFVFICVLFSGVSGFTEISSGSVSNASATASEVVHTLKEGLDIVGELNEIRKNTFGKKRERRFTEISGSLVNASSDPAKVVGTVKDVINIVEELNQIRKKIANKRERRAIDNNSSGVNKVVDMIKDVLNVVDTFDGKIRNWGNKRNRRDVELSGSQPGDPAKDTRMLNYGSDNIRELNDIIKNNYGKNRERRFAEISGSLANASSDPAKVVSTVKDVINIVDELNQIRKKIGNKRERRAADNNSSGVNKVVGMFKNILNVVDTFDGKIRNWDNKRERRDADNNYSGVNKVVGMLKDILNVVDTFDGKIRNWDNKRERRDADNNSSGVNKVVGMFKDILNVVDTFDGKIRNWDNKRERRAADNNSSGVNKVVGMFKDILNIVDTFDGKIRNDWIKKRNRRGAQLSGSLAASSVTSNVVGTAKDILDIVKELDSIRINRKTDLKRYRRFSESSSSTNYDVGSAINKVAAGFGAILKTYLYQPIAHGNFKESTIRGYTMLELPEGKSVFGSLDGELNLSYRSIWKDRHPRTGDIISCRIPSSKMAEHYMMVLNQKIIEVGVEGGKSTHKGVVMVGPWRNSSYVDSTECLHHENRVVARAEEIDDKNRNDQETERIFTSILERINCTVSGENTGNFRYDLMTCNCQDLVLYWAYGYVESDCLRTIFHGCSGYKTGTLPQIASYIDPNRPQPISPSNYALEWGGY